MPWRKWIQGQDPAKILGPYVREGMTVLEPGPGMGYFTLEAARLVGPSGRVVAVDLQSRMLGNLKKRAEKAGLLGRIDARLAPSAQDLGIGDLSGKVDFIFAFSMVHEVPDAGRFFTALAGAAKPGCLLLIAEPPYHVHKKDFEASLALAQGHGFRLEERLSIPSSHSALLRRT